MHLFATSTAEQFLDIGKKAAVTEVKIKQQNALLQATVEKST
jgi:hypothetical protein